MPYKKKKIGGTAAELEMTPMIDVVFQLLIYFIVTMKPMDISAHLDVFSPSAPQAPADPTQIPDMIRIMIDADGLVINDRVVSVANMRIILQSLASYSTEQTIMIHCAADSKHSQLVEVLDACARVGLHNLSIVTMN